MSKEKWDAIYNTSEKIGNKTHDCAWINGNMKERIELAQKVEREIIGK